MLKQINADVNDCMNTYGGEGEGGGGLHASLNQAEINQIRRAGRRLTDVPPMSHLSVRERLDGENTGAS